MKKAIFILLSLMMLLIVAGCNTSSVSNAQSIGGNSAEDVLNKYAEAWANINYKTFTGEEILPYMTREGGKNWLENLSPKYFDVYKQQKIVREFTKVEIKDLQVKDDSASAVLTVYSLQKEPGEKNCVDLPVKVFLKKIDSKWFVDYTEKQ